MKVEVENAQQNEQIDWSKNPQLVINNSGVIILTIQDQSSKEFMSSFCGIKISNGFYTNNWCKETFKPFYGKITLQND